MNIQCKWDVGVLKVWRGDNLVASVTEHGDEPLVTVYSDQDGVAYLTFTEIEHVMDNWYNMPKEKEVPPVEVLFAKELHGNPNLGRRRFKN